MNTENTPAMKKLAYGWTSTKLHLALITMALVTLVYGLAGFPVEKFDIYCFTLLGAAGIYAGSNVAATIKQRTEAPASSP